MAFVIFPYVKEVVASKIDMIKSSCVSFGSMSRNAKALKGKVSVDKGIRLCPIIVLEVI